MLKSFTFEPAEKFNTECQCPHGNLIVETNRLRIVPEEAWAAITSHLGPPLSLVTCMGAPYLTGCLFMAFRRW